MPTREETRVAIQSLGCKVNQYEADKLSTRFVQAGYQLCSTLEEANVFVINTCTVTDEADRKSRKTIRRLAQKNQRSLVVVTGCHAAAWSDELEGVHVLQIPQLQKETLFHKVDEALFGNSSEMPDTLDYHSTPLHVTRARAYIKIQDGCDRFCTYCIIPYVRGRSRSRPSHDILEEARQLINAGFQEIVITGICVGDYGQDFSPKQTLSDLMEQLLEIPYEGRFRFSSFDPCDMDEKLLTLLTSHPHVCRHLHLSLQHGSDSVLRRMARTYSKQEFYLLCRELLNREPNFAITTDIIVGFPGETEEDFRSTIDLAKSIGFSKIHVFPYSERKGTGAVKHPNQVEQGIKDRRVQQLLTVSTELSSQFFHANIGTIQHILVQRKRDQSTNHLRGYTSNYIPTLLEGDDDWKGKLVEAKLTRVVGDKVHGQASYTSK